MRFTITRRGVATPIVALLGVVAFASVASAAMPGSLTKFGDGNVTINGMSATLVNEAGKYSGVYVKNQAVAGKPVANVDFSFNYTGDTAGGAPRFSIPLNTGNYAFLDALNCGDTGTVSTESPSCAVFINTGGSYANWDDMVGQHPDWRMSSEKVAFVIADQPGTYRISKINLR